jgi:hypothetical protein
LSKEFGICFLSSAANGGQPSSLPPPWSCGRWCWLSWQTLSPIRPYPRRATAAAVAELVAMPPAWLVFALWGSLRSGLSRLGPSSAVLALFALVALAGWALPS